MPVRRFLVTFVVSALAAALLIQGLSAWLALRPAAENRLIERKIAANLARGRMALPPASFDERAVRWQTIEDLTHSPEAVLIASSHGLRVTKDMLAMTDFANLSVTGGSLPDGYVTTQLLDRAGRRPRLWIIFAEPWFFDLHADVGLWQERAREAVAFESRLARAGAPTLAAVYGPRLRKPPLTRLFSHFSLQPAIDWVEEGIRGFRYDPDPPEGGKLGGLVLRGDGSFFLTWEAGEAPPDTAALAERQLALNGDRYRYGNYDAIDPVLWDYFVRWLAFCRRDGAQVWLVLPPFHPAIYGAIVATPGNKLRLIEARCRALAAEDGIPIFGSYDPAAVGTGPLDFEDGDHLNDAGLTRLLEPAARLWKAGAAQRPAEAIRGGGGP